jgi:hypothetical protein
MATRVAHPSVTVDKHPGYPPPAGLGDEPILRGRADPLPLLSLVVSLGREGPRRRSTDLARQKGRQEGRDDDHYPCSDPAEM